jgi:hypothetical protein
VSNIVVASIALKSSIDKRCFIAGPEFQ